MMLLQEDIMKLIRDEALSLEDGSLHRSAARRV